ncbi:DarT ssDNA thymidine ADP-ribosyltransferase family protein [Jeotgalibacillus sp. JSM ZJ347]|uniref:DarT ssDNA thymidine ADP-ribosyltransferase family protein n=1 Tax=Jeotgalibacillus sp. JSM ZJ347 TaxID=3342117 RepID=UPI0035A98B2D
MIYSDEKAKIKKFVEGRDIRYLVHFTKAKNLYNILTEGLLPVQTLTNKELAYNFNDEKRMDGYLDASCLSIQFPNYKMFYKYRCRDWSEDWVILGIRASVLWEKHCMYCVENAASNKMKNTPAYDKKGLRGLQNLYQEYPGKPSRKELKINDSYPTHPQAEVLVFDEIGLDDILGIAFENQYTLNNYRAIIPPTIKARVSKKLFECRIDDEHWRRKEDTWLSDRYF